MHWDLQIRYLIKKRTFLKVYSHIMRDMHLKEMFRGSSIALGFKFFSIAVGYLFFYVLARRFGAEGVGIFSTCWTLLMISAVIGKLGFDSSIVKFIAGSLAKNNYSYTRKVYWRCLALVFLSSGLVGITISVFDELLSELFFEGVAYAYLIKWAGISVIPLSILQYNAESMKGMKDITAFSVFQNGSIYLVTLLVILLLNMFYNFIGLPVISLTISVFFLALVTFFITIPRFDKPQRIANGDQLRSFDYKRVIRTTFPMMLSNSLFFLMNWMDILMLSAFKEEAAVGIYNTALKISALTTVALVAVNSIAMPKIAELYEQGKKAHLIRFTKQTTLFNTLLSMPVFLIILLVPEFLLGIFGEAFVMGRVSLLLLAIGQFFSAFSGSTIQMLDMTGKEKTTKNILIITSVFNFVMNYILIPRYGIEGAAVATALSTVLWNALSIIYIYKYYRFTTFPFFAFRKKINS